MQIYVGIIKNLLIAIGLLEALSGCALLRSQVTVFHQLPQDFSGTTYVMIPFKEQEGSLEHKAYEEAVRQELNAKGFRETTVDQAQVAVFLSYGIDTGREVVSSYPIIGQTGVSSSSTSGNYSKLRQLQHLLWHHDLHAHLRGCGNRGDIANSVHACLET